MYNRYTAYYPMVPLAMLLLYFIYRAATVPFFDFAGYYFGSQQLLQGNYLNAYDTYSLNALIAQKGYTGVFVSYTPFPPFTAAVFAPFLLLPVTASKIVFNIFSAVLFTGTVFRAGRFFNIRSRILFLLPVIFFVPLRNNIFFGQSYLLLCVLLLEGYMAYKKGRLPFAAVLWSVAILFKIFPLFILFFLLAKRQYRMVGYCIGACAALGLLSLLCTGMAAWQWYVFTLFPRVNNGELNAPFTFMFQSALMLFKNLFVYDAMQNKQALYDNPYLLVVLMALFKAAVLAACIGTTVQKKGNDFVVFATWMTASVLISPNGSSYSLIILLLPLLACSLPGAWLSLKKQWHLYGLMALVFLIAAIPVQYFSNLPVLLRFPRLYLLVLFFVLFITVFSKAVLPAVWMWIFFVLFMSTELPKFFVAKDSSTYVLNDAPLLMYDFGVHNNRLAYYYWDDAGAHETVTLYPVLQQSRNGVCIQHNQVYYYGRALTASPDLKRKALLINGRFIVYLSDKNRGVGFYTLRSLPAQVPAAGDAAIPLSFR